MAPRIPNEFITAEDTTRLIITRKNGDSYAALVDTDKVDLLRRYRWYVDVRKKSGYTRVVTLQASGHIYLHRLVMMASPDKQVDHINNDPLDNRRSNLREVTNAENAQNRRRNASRNTSGIPGVWWNKSCGKWQATVVLDYTPHYLGVYTCIDEAATAVNDFRAANMPFSKEAQNKED